jgi:hypothetical protein
MTIAGTLLAIVTTACSGMQSTPASPTFVPAPPGSPAPAATAPVTAASPSLLPLKDVPDNCTFEQGTTTCTSTATHTETGTHTAFSGCLYGPFRQPGRRLRTFEDTYLITETTTTYQHGKSGKLYDSHTETSRDLVSSRLVSDVCEPL